MDVTKKVFQEKNSKKTIEKWVLDTMDMTSRALRPKEQILNY